MAKPKVSKEEKKLVDLFKLIFSTLTSRSCQYAYLFPGTDRFILANSTTTRAPNELKKNLIVDHEFHGDRVMNFMDGDLGIHVVEVKDRTFMEEVRRILQLDSFNTISVPHNRVLDENTFHTNPINSIWVVKTDTFLSAINKHSLDKLLVEVQVGTHEDLYLHLVPSGTELTKKNLTAFNLINYHYEQLLWEYLERLPQLYAEITSGTYPFFQHILDLQPVLIGKSYQQTIEFDNLKDHNGDLIFPDCKSKYTYLAIDGLNSVSLKEFVKKVSNQPFTLNQYFWVANNHRVLSITRFDNDVVDVISMRPNIQLSPLPDILKLVPPEELPIPVYT